MSRHLSTDLVVPSGDTRDFLKVAHRLVDALWLEGYRFAKAGIMLSAISHKRPEQLDIFYQADAKACEKSDTLMQVLDAVNLKYGKHTATFATEGIKKPWAMSRNMLSPQYTTNLKDILVV